MQPIAATRPVLLVERLEARSPRLHRRVPEGVYNRCRQCAIHLPSSLPAFLKLFPSIFGSPKLPAAWEDGERKEHDLPLLVVAENPRGGLGIPEGATPLSITHFSWPSE